jgi:integrative and conjugative element protein (TIGR02256 family)
MDDQRGLPTVSITDVARRTIAGEATRSHDGLETGGILLGTDMVDRIVISRAGGPGPRAYRGTHAFLRDLAYARQLADAAWREEGTQWVGEWHTHPSGDLIPSELDLRSYLCHLYDTELRLDRFVAVIVGPVADAGVTAATWLIEWQRVRLVPLAVTTPPLSD